jgi:nucleotide-binding universal stress UspA family protein
MENRMTINTILVPIDFSETSAHVLDLARMLADTCGASMHLMHVIGYPLATATTADDERQDACRRMDALVTDDDRHKRHVTTSCEIGTPAHEIVKYATEHTTDLIVMGTHWHGPSFQSVSGSIAETVLGLAPCAVLAVKDSGPGRCDFEFDRERAKATA